MGLVSGVSPHTQSQFYPLGHDSCFFLTLADEAICLPLRSPWKECRHRGEVWEVSNTMSWKQ